MWRVIAQSWPYCAQSLITASKSCKSANRRGRGDRKRLASKDDRQLSAIGEIFHFVFTAARDKMRVTKAEEVLRSKEYLLESSKTS